MQDEENNKIKLSSDIADGKKINWKQSSNTSEEFRKLQAVENISQAFAQFRLDSSNLSSSEKEKYLFSWGHLQVIEKIGSGSFGDVYRAFDPVLNRDVALKLRRSDSFAVIGNSAFLQEARRIARIRQRNVIAVHGAATHDGQIGIWTDLLYGQNLKQHFSNNKIIDKATVYQLVLDIAHALVAVHESGIVHGDIKPSNIMRQDDGKFVLMDFGAGGELDDKLCKPTTGSPLFMAPELLTGSTANSASDHYSFGVMLYQLLSGQYPYLGESVNELKHAHDSNNKIPLYKLCPKLPKGLCDLVDDLMSMSPSSRPNAQQLIKRIHWLINAPNRRKRQLFIFGIIASLSIGFIVSGLGYIKATQEKEKAESISIFLQDLLSSPSYLSQGKEIKVMELLERATEDLDNSFDKSNHIKADIYYAIGRSYLVLRLAKESIQQFKKSLSLKKQIYGASSIEVQSVLQDIMSAYTLLDDDEQVKITANKIIKLASINSKTPSHESKMAKITLLSRPINEDKYKNSEEVLISMLADFKDSDPHNYKNNDEKYFILIGLKKLYFKQSKFDLSENYARQALDWIIQRSPKMRANQIALKTNIADLLVKQGKMSDANIAYQDLLESSKLFYGEINQGYLGVLMNYGVYLSDIKNYEKALKAQKEALNISLKLYGELHEMTISIKINISIILKDTQNLSEAEEMMRNTLVDSRKVLGETHTTVLISELNFADLLNEQGKYQEAEILAKINVENLTLKLGENHFITLMSQTELARSMSNQNRYTESENIYTETFLDMKKSQGMNSPYTQSVLQNYINHLIKFDQTAQAKEKLNILYNAQKESLGENHVDTLESKKQLDNL